MTTIPYIFKHVRWEEQEEANKKLHLIMQPTKQYVTTMTEKPGDFLHVGTVKSNLRPTQSEFLGSRIPVAVFFVM